MHAESVCCFLTQNRSSTIKNTLSKKSFYTEKKGGFSDRNLIQGSFEGRFTL